METKYVTINGEQLIIDSFNVEEIYSPIVDGVIVISQTTLDEETQTKKSSEISRHFIVEQIDNSVKFLKEIPVSELEKHIDNVDSLNAKLFLAKYSNNISLLKKLSSEENNNIILNLTENYFVDINILREIVEKTNNEEILLNAVKHHNANIDVFKILYDKGFTELFTQTVEKVPVEIIENMFNNADKLSTSEKRGIYIQLAIFPNTPKYILDKITEQDESLETFLVFNPNVSPEIIRKLYKLRDNLQLLLPYISANPNTPKDILENIYSELGENPMLKDILATNPNLPEHLFEELVKKGSDNIKYGLASNVNISTKILNQLATETNDNIILFAIVVNKNANLETLNIVRKKNILRNELLSKIEERVEQ